MLVCEFTIDEGEFKNRRVGFYNVMTGGKTSKGDIMPIRQLLELIDGLKAPWAVSPSDPLVARPFKSGQGRRWLDHVRQPRHQHTHHEHCYDPRTGSTSSVGFRMVSESKMAQTVSSTKSRA